MNRKRFISLTLFAFLALALLFTRLCGDMQVSESDSTETGLVLVEADEEADVQFWHYSFIAVAGVPEVQCPHVVFHSESCIQSHAQDILIPPPEMMSFL